MSLLDIFRRKKVSNMNTSVSSDTLANMFWDYKTELAYHMYMDDTEYRNSLKIPKSIVNTIVTSASQEFDFSINGDSKELNRVCKYLKDTLKIAESHLCVGGQLAFKPYIKNNRIGISLYGGRDFVPYYNDLGLLDTVYFKTDIRESEYKSFTLVEIHTYNSDTYEYHIDYQLYDSSNSDWNRRLGKQAPSLGSRVPLDRCEKTRDLDEFLVIEDIDDHLCSIVNLDNSMNYNRGRSIYESCFNLINEAEKVYDGLLWEYDGGELAIDAPADLFRAPGSYNKNYSMPKGKDRLYRRLEHAPIDFDIKVFAPTLRDESYIRGLNEILKKIEKNCSLYSGSLSSVEYSERTATEVIASKQRFYVQVMDIKNRMKTGIEDIINSCVLLNNRLLPEFMGESITVDFKIGDSVIDLILPTEHNE